MEDIKLEYRMFGLVPYNISPIQQGIQYGHAVVEYVLVNLIEKVMKGEEIDLESLKALYTWAKYDKTFIILNGGTTNLGIKNRDLGTLNQHLVTLKDMGIKVAKFHEPDLGDQLTAVVFLLDERVWDKEKYPDPPEKSEYTVSNQGVYYINYDKAISNMGGEKIYEIRQFMNQFRLA